MESTQSAPQWVGVSRCLSVVVCQSLFVSRCLSVVVCQSFVVSRWSSSPRVSHCHPEVLRARRTYALQRGMQSSCVQRSEGREPSAQSRSSIHQQQFPCGLPCLQVPVRLLRVLQRIKVLNPQLQFSCGDHAEHSTCTLLKFVGSNDVVPKRWPGQKHGSFVRQDSRIIR